MRPALIILTALAIINVVALLVKIKLEGDLRLTEMELRQLESEVATLERKVYGNTK